MGYQITFQQSTVCQMFGFGKKVNFFSIVNRAAQDSFQKQNVLSKCFQKAQKFIKKWGWLFAKFFVFNVFFYINHLFLVQLDVSYSVVGVVKSANQHGQKSRYLPLLSKSRNPGIINHWPGSTVTALLQRGSNKYLSSSLTPKQSFSFCMYFC